MEQAARSNGGDDDDEKPMEGSAQTDGRVPCWKQNASLPWLAHKMEYGYFLLQPSLPPREVMVVRGVVQR